MTEDQLISQLRAKGRAGAEMLYDRYAKTLYGVLVKTLKNKELAEDVLQLAFVKICNSFESYDPDKGRLFTWMIAIIRNQARDYCRGKFYNQSLTTESLAYHIGYIEENNKVIFNTETIGIKALVNELRDEHKEVINLIYFKGYTQTQVADELKIPLGTVKTRCRTAVCILRAKFSGPVYAG